MKMKHPRSNEGLRGKEFWKALTFTKGCAVGIRMHCTFLHNRLHSVR